jgi:hypothetical protein
VREGGRRDAARRRGREGSVDERVGREVKLVANEEDREVGGGERACVIEKGL